MKTTNLTLDLQAYVDGRLEPGRRAEIERVLASDAEARALVDGLRALGALLREHEPAARVPETREFYWSQIQRRLAAAEAGERRAETAPASTASGWLRWLAPALGVAAVAVVISLQTASHSVELASVADAETLTFHSDADGVTIHWIN
jgi:anti-sigma factor RsiW